MKNYKFISKLFLIFCLASNLFADNVKQNFEEDNSITYLSLQRQVSRAYRVTGNFKKDTKYNKSHVFYERVVKYEQNNFEDEVESNQKYNVSGLEAGFDVLFMDSKNSYDISGNEISYYHKKLTFTDYQKAQIKYLEMERQSKILVLDREINSKKKLLDEELAKDFADVFLIDELAKEIKLLSIDKETVNINVDKKIRYVLPPEQYLKYKDKQNKQNKNKQNKNKQK